jgi:hypothetical protein
MATPAMAIANPNRRIEMRHRILSPLAVAAAGFALFAACSAISGQTAKKSAAAPLMALMDRFTAAGVPAMGPAETEVPALKWDKTTPPGLPGNGMAQHPMLYVGEGYNKILLVNNGKIIWTYSTGSGWEYDDVWMLSNGNILFTRMQYVAEVTPNKKVVWRYDNNRRKDHTEIHTCQPIGLDKVMFVQNGLPPRLMVVNIKTKRGRGESRPARSQPSMPGSRPRAVPPRALHRAGNLSGSFPGNEPGGGIRQGFQGDLELRHQEPLGRHPPQERQHADHRRAGHSHARGQPQGRDGLGTQAKRPAGGLPVLNTQSCTRLANGNTIICSRGGNGKGPQLVEVTPDKKVVWVLQDWANLGPATAVQILDDPGIPESGPPGPGGIGDPRGPGVRPIYVGQASRPADGELKLGMQEACATSFGGPTRNPARSGGRGSVYTEQEPIVQNGNPGFGEQS